MGKLQGVVTNFVDDASRDVARAIQVRQHYNAISQRYKTISQH